MYEYIYPDTPDYIFEEFFRMAKKQIIAMGHTHIPFVKKFDNKLILNPGSVGQPRGWQQQGWFLHFGQ